MLRNHSMAHKDNLATDIVPRVIIIQAIYKKSVASTACELFSFVGRHDELLENSSELDCIFFCGENSCWISNSVLQLPTTSAFMILTGTSICYIPVYNSVFNCCAGNRKGRDIQETFVHCLGNCKEIILKEVQQGMQLSHSLHYLSKTPLINKIFQYSTSLARLILVWKSWLSNCKPVYRKNRKLWSFQNEITISRNFLAKHLYSQKEGTGYQRLWRNCLVWASKLVVSHIK